MFLDGIAFKVLNTKDYSRLAIWIPKVILKMIFLWPGTVKTYVILIFVTCCSFLNFGVFFYFIFNINDFAKATYSMSMFTMTFQALCKICILWYHSKKLNEVLREIMDRFWPYDILDDEELQRSLKKLYSILLTMMTTSLCTGLIYNAAFLPTPLLFGTERSLPFPSMYFFDWSISPVYELFYVIQCVTFLYMMTLGAVGMDYMVLTVCACITAQYRILQYSFMKFNTPAMFSINEKFKTLGEIDNPHYNVEKKYLVRCIEHHHLLLRVTRKINQCFSAPEFLQLGISIVAMCIGLFDMTKEHSRSSEYAAVGMFIFANTLQLLIYSGIANEIKYQASNLPQYIYLSNWIEASEASKKDLLFVLAKSQEILEMTTYNLYSVDLSLFLRILKVSFSGFTLLSTMSSK